MLHAIGTLVVLAGFGLALFGSICFLIAEFKEGPLWGIAGLIFPIVNLVFLILFWPKAKNAFFLELYGIGFLIAGALLFHAHIPLIG